MGHPLTCHCCGEWYIAPNLKVKYCSTKCRQEAGRQAQKRYREKTVGSRAEYNKQWAIRNPEQSRSNHYKKRYGISLEDIEAMLESQGGVCPICNKSLKVRGVKGRDLAVVDHCHTTSSIRGLLCTPCNLMIGYAQDTPEVLAKAIKYLENSNKNTTA
jgi:hypothetical protein